MQSLREVLKEILKDPTPEDPIDIYWQNKTMKKLIREALPELEE